MPAGSEREDLLDSSGHVAGAVIREWRSLSGTIEVCAERLDSGLWRLGVRIENRSDWRGEDRADALRQTFCSTHTVLRARGGEFVSITDPPDHLRTAAEGCANAGTWPVLVGEQGDRRTLLSSPIILPDYPQIAPESPGDLFDGGEIDALLIHSIRSLTDAEREEMRATDPRVREILERSTSLSPERMLDLYGAVREMRPLER